MNEMSFSLRLGAKDDSQGGLRAWQSSVLGAVRAVSKPITIPLKIASAGLGLLRDINLGLKPLVEGLDKVIERGTALDATRRSFISLVGGGAKSADQLAERLVAASHGTLRLGQAMELANRSIISGIDAARDLPTILDFASKKAVTTGMDVGSSLERIIMGLSRGSPAILDDFNLLVNGLDGVKDSYDQIKGKGAWEQLGPAAQKAEIIRQAMEDMQRQLGRIGVRGNETVFVWKQIKTQIGDAMDKLFAAIGRSDALKGALIGIRDVIGGMTKHFEKGGSLGELLFGKEGGASGGLFGGLKAGVLDLGELLGRGILGGLLKGLAALAGLLAKVREAVLELADEVGEKLKSKLSEIFPKIGGGGGGIAEQAGKMVRRLPEVAGEMARRPGEVPGAAWFGAKTAGSSMLMGFGRALGLVSPEELEAYRAGINAGRRATTQPAGVGTGYGFGVIPSALAAAAMGVQGNGFVDWAGRKGDELLGGGVLAGNWRLPGWFEQWQSEFPPGGARYIPGAPPPEARGMSLTAAGVSARERNVRLLDREIRREEGLSRREARKAAGEQARELYRQGWEVTPEDRARLERENYEKISGFRTGQARQTRDAIKAELEARRPRKTMTDDELAGIGRTVPPEATHGKVEDQKKSTSLLSKISESVRQQVELTRQLLGAIGGVERAATG